MTHLKSLMALAAMLGFLTLSACNTVEGVGEDVRATGQAIDDAAEESGANK
jgi:predicted small secreted protein